MASNRTAEAGVNESAPEQRIRRSWARNAAVWTEVVRAQGIASRREATNQAMLDTVCAAAPRRVLDIGCGEGWLMRRLSADGVDCVGIDAEPALIHAAQAQGGGVFEVCAYQELRAWAAHSAQAPFDVWVCNFSLLGDESTDAVFDAARDLLAPGGRLIVQTLHPSSVEQGACSGWREGSWAGFDSRFTDPAPWYFRPLADWHALFTRHELLVTAQYEPLLPATGRAVSLILVGKFAEFSAGRQPMPSLPL